MDLEQLEKELKKMDGLVLELEELGLAGHRQEIDKLHRRLDKLKKKTGGIMKQAMKLLRVEIARIKEISTDLQQRRLTERANHRKGEAERLQKVHDLLESNYLKWKAIFGQY